MKKSIASIVSALTVSVFLAGCGGGGGGGESTAPNGPPDVVSNTGTTITVAANQRQIMGDCTFTQTLGSPRNDNLRISRVSWLQTVEQDANAPDARLAGAKAVKMRIDVLASNSPLAPLVRSIRVFDPSTNSCTTLPVSAPTRVPSTVTMRNLSTAFTADIPASLVKQGMSVALWLDDGAGRSVAEADATYRILAPRVAPTVVETVRIIPIRLNGVTGNVSSTADIKSLLERLYPLSQINVVVAPVYDIGGLLNGVLSLVGSLLTGNLGQFQDLLDVVDDRCAQLNGSQPSARAAPKCMGMLPSNLVFNSANNTGQIVGLAYVGGTTLLTRAVTTVDNFSITSPYISSHWIDFNAMTLAHEFGHLMDLDHAACGGATGLDPRLYSNGLLGNGAGYDAVRGTYFSSANTSEFADIMSYCGKEWMSDSGYLAAMAYRSGSADIAARAVNEPSQWLKISRGAAGWKVRRVDFAPSTLTASKLSLRVNSNHGSETLALRSAVVSEHHHGENFGPFFINLADREVSSLGLESAGIELANWSVDAL